MALLRMLLLIFSQQGIDIQLLQQQANETFSENGLLFGCI
jgi:hypothetical protein